MTFFESGEGSLENVNVLSNGVLLIRKGLENKPTGDAFVLFDTEECAGVALRKHRVEIQIFF